MEGACMRRFVALSSLVLTSILSGGAQRPAPPQPPTRPAERVRAIAPPAKPLPSEAESRRVRRFSFIAYGDTRGRRDGLEIQYEHSLIVDSMLARIKQLDATPYPVKFVLQSGDAAVNGSDGHQWNVSFVPLIDRLTRDGGVPYFLAPGNHDVNTDAQVALQHLVRPDPERGGNPYHYVVVRVDGDQLDLEVVGVDWGAGFQPYRSNKIELQDRR